MPSKEQNLMAMILCAGLGTRLRPLTLTVPKPAVPVGGIPLIRWNLGLLAQAGIGRAVVNVHYLADEMEAAAQEAADELGMQLAVSREPIIAGTGGGLREARSLLEGAETIVLWNGDILFDLDLTTEIRAHQEAARKGALATMLLLPMPKDEKYGTVEINSRGSVRRIADKFGPGPLSGESLIPLHFASVHLLSSALLDHLPREPFEADINRHIYPPLMDNDGVRGRLCSGYWNDLGTPQRYRQANADVKEGKVNPAHFNVRPRN